MITWEPFTNSFSYNAKYPGLQQNKDFCKAVINGALDEYIEAFALKIKALEKPVFIRFAHEPDNPVYPWSATGGNTADDYKASWQHVVKVFVNLGITNVTWVWNPWNPSTIDEYYPGKQYVDWIGLTALNYGKASYDGQWRSFKQIYSPIRKKIRRLSKPVMLAEFGTTAYGGDQAAWLTEATQFITESIPEIKSLVFFYSNRDRYWINSWRPDSTTRFIDWTFGQSKPVFDAAKNALTVLPKPSYISSVQSPLLTTASHTNSISGKAGNYSLRVDGKPFYIQGVAYNPAHDWRDGDYPLSKKQLIADFSAIKAMGANTIRRYHPGVYDRNILNTASEHDLKVLYGFWFDPEVDYYKDSLQVQQYIQRIVKLVEQHKDHPAILGWG
ncbi:hypothetical protein GXP67_33415 [Rhodocytophaga rosea]|uniref:GH26 domain-containing protein n=1 Tax=Rhodocytophaga rosea TaxID=2704465 RepID=A0A6C0GTS0_9BACT|nr:glycosyl hydrolase [Rhodocytophaga rosea]QHT71204.1 hypothetical protein GXP67_33415 [Rhodocytophaga rosea]